MESKGIVRYNEDKAMELKSVRRTNDVAPGAEWCFGTGFGGWQTSILRIGSGFVGRCTRRRCGGRGHRRPGDGGREKYGFLVVFTQGRRGMELCEEGASMKGV